MRRKRKPILVVAGDVDIGDLLFERASYLAETEVRDLAWCLGRVTGTGSDPNEGTVDLWINSYVDPPDSGWYQYHQDEVVLVVRAARVEDADAGTRQKPRI